MSYNVDGVRDYLTSIVLIGNRGSDGKIRSVGRLGTVTIPDWREEIQLYSNWYILYKVTADQEKNECAEYVLKGCLENND
jgi:hypothetical protein